MPRYQVKITATGYFDADDNDGAINAAMDTFKSGHSDLDTREMYQVTEVDVPDILVNPNYLRSR
jgi:hypothetical protein